MAVENTCLIIAGILMLITIIILIIGTIIVSFCSRDDEIDYHMLPQGDWHPEHLDYDSIIDLLQNIQKSKKFQDLQDFLAQGKHLVHLNNKWVHSQCTDFPICVKYVLKWHHQNGADLPYSSGISILFILRMVSDNTSYIMQIQLDETLTYWAGRFVCFHVSEKYKISVYTDIYLCLQMKTKSIRLDFGGRFNFQNVSVNELLLNSLVQPI